MSLENLAFVPFHVAPGVYINVVAQPLPNVGFPQRYNALFFIASDQGPANEIVYITSQEQFIQTFGAPQLNYPWSSIYAYYWSNLANALCVRLLPYDATAANLTYAFITNMASATSIQLNSNSQPVFTIAAGYLSASSFTVVYSSNSYNIGQVMQIGNVIESSITVPTAFPFAIFSGNGPYYNNINLNVVPSVYPGFINVAINYLTSNLYLAPNVSLEPNTNYLGMNTQITNATINNILSYSFNSLNYYAVIQGQLGIGNGYSIVFMQKASATSPITSVTVAPSNTLTISSIDVIYTCNASSFTLNGGSNGSLGSGTSFNYHVFSQLVIDALTGQAQSTGASNAYLATPIYSLLDETYPFVKYVFDPSDYWRFAQNDVVTVQATIQDYVTNKWFANQGALFLANIAPINNPFNSTEVTSKQFFNSSLVVAYCSSITGVLYGSLQLWPQLAFVARDLVQLRAGQYSVLPFAGPIQAEHADAISLARKYSLSERDQLVLYGINYAVQDVDYGIYTDLDRTTTVTATMLRWMYVVEDLIDMKYELQKLLKQYLHQLQTFNWNLVKKQIEQVILKPRVDEGLLLNYSVDIVMDQNYLNQNVLPIILSVQYAREIERIAVTIFVQ